MKQIVILGKATKLTLGIPGYQLEIQLGAPRPQNYDAFVNKGI